ncbi:catechol 2,3-dioxygenase-like lactoylglutathione lyase family enzyme [Comamonas sp. BIGb0152]|uniref:VOC family protein n=1 Tax=Comamonas sp. BIGb0152 TaxID=2940601 RepID=UPI002168D2D4|nr:VOC family protein [Comamonas sp. BIGb0152]MCS4294016.1 catechol 2,3-dioxygenase-like lactoylglutathione lyase family enzyme [Comamonas sp. BIGb0152]
MSIADSIPPTEATPALVEGLDHLVLTVASIAQTLAFYQRVLGMEAREFKPGRWALHFGGQKINLHEVGTVVDPNVRHATPGSADLCFRTAMPLADVAAHLQRQQVAIVQGPVRATGARAPLQSLYFYDPDENLVEVANEVMNEVGRR